MASRGIVLDKLSLRCERACASIWDARAREMMQATLCRRSRPCWHSLSTASAHATYLRPDGSGKAAIAKPKAMFGPVAATALGTTADLSRTYLRGTVQAFRQRLAEPWHLRE